MQTLLEASTAKPQASEAVVDDRASATAAAPQTDKPQTSGWDAFEVWRTRVLQRAP